MSPALSSLTRRQRDRLLTLLPSAPASTEYSTSSSNPAVAPAPGPRLERDAPLVTDSHAAYPAFAREAGIAHEAVNPSAGAQARRPVHPERECLSQPHACLALDAGWAARWA